MNTVWKGAISFGLVHIPVKMHSATEDHDIHFRTLHKSCSTPISMTRTCPRCDVKVDSADTVKGYEYESSKFVLFSEEEIEAIKPESARVIQILSFADLPQIDPIYFDKPRTSYLVLFILKRGEYCRVSKKENKNRN
ncbi:Ku protein [Candidatus Pristimantibacillus sp. PTI5]|uniref:Ku protein n=1 Tax=Candidatus Pristimantibacillus sp. PTI5 TaxID=3400422 RepID=UPI003B029FEC